MVGNEKDSILQSIDDSLRKIREGSLVEGKIVGMSVAEAFVDIGYKSDGSVALSEFEAPSSLKVGDKFKFYLEKIVEDEGLIFLSKSKADSLLVWEELRKSYEEKVTLEGKIMRMVKGGYIINIKGIEAFLPGSQVDVVEVKDPSKFQGEVVSVRVTKFDRLRNNVVVSRKVILAEELRKKRDEFWVNIKEGEILDGVVKGITDFGAFVDTGGIDGLVHIGDLSWGRVTHPSEILRVGDKVKVKVLGIDKEEGHLTLGIKQLTPSPWENVEERYPVSSKIKGKVTSLTDYGAFVELEPGVEGLIHISEMSWSRVSSPSDILGVGDTVQAIVLSVDKLDERISLSLRQTQPNPWEQVAEKYPQDSIVTGAVKSFSKAGAIIELKDGIEGFLHISDLSWTEHIEHPGDILSKKQQLKCRVLNVDPQNQRLSLGLKQMEKDPLVVLKESMSTPVKGKVKEVLDKGITVKISVGKHKIEGFIPSSHLLKQSKKKAKVKYETGEELSLTLLEVDEERRRVILSEKEYSELEEQKETEEYLKDSQSESDSG